MKIDRITVLNIDGTEVVSHSSPHDGDKVLVDGGEKSQLLVTVEVKGRELIVQIAYPFVTIDPKALEVLALQHLARRSA